MRVEQKQPKQAQTQPAASPLDGLNKHRRFNRAVANCLYSDPLTRDTGQAIANCSQRLTLRFGLKGEQLSEPQLVGGQLCNRRLCPFCEWRRTRIWRARLIQGLESYSEFQPKMSALFLTLTLKNCQLYELRETIRHLHRSFKRLTLIQGFPTSAWFRRTEVSLGKSFSNSGPLFTPQAHPHIHALLLVRPSYWTRGYWSQLKWQREWQMAARLDYSPVVDIRRAHSGPSPDRPERMNANLAATLEAAKYSTKAADLVGLGNNLPCFNTEMKNLRLYGVSAQLRHHIKSGDIRPGELLEPSKESDESSFTAVAKWFDAIQEYQFVL